MLRRLSQIHLHLRSSSSTVTRPHARAAMSSSSYPSTIKGIGIHKTGGVENIEELSLPFPEVKPDHVLVKVQWVGVNFIDTYLRSGFYPPPFIPLPVAKEAAGIIAELPTDASIVSSEQYKRRNFQKGAGVAIDVAGALKEYVSVPWEQVYPLPPSVAPRTAAAALLQGITTLSLLTESHNVSAGETVLIHTVAGGVGLLMAQLAHARGATVIGTTSTPAKAALARAHGADHVILYKEEDTVKRVLELTGGEGAHVIYDGVGKDTFESDFKMIRRKGTLVSFGNASGAVPPVPLFKLTEKNIKLLRPTEVNYVTLPSEREHYGNLLWELVGSGKLKVNIHGEYPFTPEGVRQAHLDLTTGKTTGKLLIKVSDD
ncbi:NAD-P-binding protein [Dentipellis sp. KUC8613]|nr:NAD-P-binding protein [Dentipellis sp. KUC8613]